MSELAAHSPDKSDPYQTIAEEIIQRRMRLADAALLRVRAEIERAIRKYPPMHSPHEAYAVILEEVDELWDEVKKKSSGRTPEAMTEAMQVAAMSVRYLMDFDGSLTAPDTGDNAGREFKPVDYWKR